MQTDSRSSSTASPPPVEAEESDFYAQPNDSTTSDIVGVAEKSGGGDGDLAVVASAPMIVELDFKNTPVHRLPNEILMHIFGKFDSPKDVFACMLVCKRWARHSVDFLWHRPSCVSVDNLESISKILEKPHPFFSYRLFVRRINLSSLSTYVTDSKLRPLSVCSRLERLTLSNCSQISDDGLTAMLANTPSLLALDASQVTDITGQSIHQLARNCHRLQGLNITNCLNVSNDSLVKLAENCRYLKRLKFNGCSQIANSTVTAFAEKCPNIVEIDLMNCLNIGNAPVAALLAHGQALRELRLAGCELISDDAFLSLPPLKMFNHLRILDLTSCALLTDQAVEKIISAAPRLRNLVLNKCRALTDSAVHSISRLGKNLHYLHLGHCGNITDDGVKKLVQECTRIRYIDLGCCTHLTDESIIQLAALPKLKRIGLVKCLRITDECVKALARRKPRDQYSSSSSLERVHLSYCTALTLDSIYILLNSCLKLTHLSLTGVQAFQNPKFAEFCRTPPQEFNPHQREMFCVFSGNGVPRFREFLNRAPEFQYLKPVWREHVQSQHQAWQSEIPQYHGHFTTSRNPFGPFVRDNSVPVPVLPYNGRPFIAAPHPEHVAGQVGMHHAPNMFYVSAFTPPHQGPGHLTHGGPPPGGYPPGTMFYSVGEPPNGMTNGTWYQWVPADASPNTVSPGVRPDYTNDFAGIAGDMPHSPGFRRPRASTATGVVRWPDGATLDSGDGGSSSGEQTVVGAPTSATAPQPAASPSQTANDDVDAEDEEDGMIGGAHL